VSRASKACRTLKILSYSTKYYTEYTSGGEAVKASFVVLGGPIGDGTRRGARLIVRTDTEQDVRDRMADDSWMQLGLLEMESMEEGQVQH
jgi:hypothetical protein